MSELYFDLQEGTVLVGSAAYEQGVMVGRHIHDLQLVKDLLLDDSFMPNAERYSKVDCNDWKDEDYRRYAGWIHRIINEEAGQTAQVGTLPVIPIENVYQTAYRMGLGPEVRKLTRHFDGTLWSLHDAMGFGGSYARGKYENWTNRDFVDYGRTLVESLGGRKPRGEDFHAAFVARKGPHPRLITSRVGIANLQERLGLPYIPGWTEDDYVDYGVKIIEANPGLKLTRYVFDELGRHQRGPSTRSIVNHFGSLSKYKEMIREEHLSKHAQREQERALTYNATVENIGCCLLPKNVFEETLGNQEVTIRKAAIYTLITTLLPHIAPTPATISRIASRKDRSLINFIRGHNDSITVADIEVCAEEMRIFDDIWPQKDYLIELKVGVKPSVRKSK